MPLPTTGTVRRWTWYFSGKLQIFVSALTPDNLRQCHQNLSLVQLSLNTSANLCKCGLCTSSTATPLYYGVDFREYFMESHRFYLPWIDPTEEKGRYRVCQRFAPFFITLKCFSDFLKCSVIVKAICYLTHGMRYK